MTYDASKTDPRRPSRGRQPADRGLLAPARTAPRSAHRAFTLVELMISIALVVVLILGVNQVFQATSTAVGTGEAINAALRDGRAFQSTFAADFAGVLPNGPGSTDGPWIAFSSRAVAAFANVADQAGDRDGNPLTRDLGGTGKEGDPTVPGDVTSPATYNNSNHRLDTLGFFSRGNFQRQTGNDGTFVPDMTANEAWVWYGHAQLPTNDATPVYVDPASGTAATNPNNFFASQFVLARMAMLLRPSPDPTNINKGGYIYDNSTPNPIPQAYVLCQPAAAGGYSSPCFANCPLYIPPPPPYPAVTVTGFTTSVQSRVDLGGASVRQIRTGLSSYLYYGGADTWWNTVVGLSAAPATPPARFQANPFVVKPLTSAAMAQASPYFVRGCSQFTVEYAGDFLTQDNNTANGTTTYGNVTAAAADGTLDYTLVQPPGGSADRSTWTKQVKWYGLPRNTSGLFNASTKQPTLGVTNTATGVITGDVMPLNDWINYAGLVNPYLSTATPPGFEKQIPPYSTDHSADPAAKLVYTCVFGPKRSGPKLIRITVTVVDPTGRLPEGQTYQSVFVVPPQ